MRLVSSFLLLILSPIAKADFASVQECLSKKYQKLTDRDGIVAAVVDSNQTKIMTFGTAKEETIYEIGSVTKSFTGILLAHSITARAISLDEFIPAEYQKPDSDITYKHLTTHTSGIIGGNFKGYVSPNEESPYEGLNIPLFKKLYSETPLVSSPGEKWAYSNIATGLLGLILSENSGKTYNALVEEVVFKNLMMNDSHFRVPESELARFAQGYIAYEGEKAPYSHWNLYDTAINPAGGIRSTIGDMAKYAYANLFPEKTNMKATLELAQQPLYKMGESGKWMGINWIIEPDKQLIWHNGSTIGFNSILAISKKQEIAVVAMTNTGVFKNDVDGEVVSDDALQEVAFSCLE
jgi:serine-type D-Ala-D-Ala carboxypeptidase/endopeptidase